MKARGSVGRGLRALRSRLPRRRDPIRIELDPAEQWIVLHLARVGQASATDLRDVVRLERPLTTEEQVRLSLVRFESLRLVERVADPSPGVPQSTASRGRVYRLSADGRRVRRAIPPDPRSSIETNI